MDTLYIGLIVIGALFFVLVGYVIAVFSYGKHTDDMQRKLVDAYDENSWTEKKYKQLKLKYQDKLDMITDLEATNALLRKANEQIYEDGIKDGKQNARIEAIKEIGKSLLDESVVLKNGGIVSKSVPINQVRSLQSTVGKDAKEA